MRSEAVIVFALSLCFTSCTEPIESSSFESESQIYVLDVVLDATGPMDTMMEIRQTPSDARFPPLDRGESPPVLPLADIPPEVDPFDTLGLRELRREKVPFLHVMDACTGF